MIVINGMRYYTNLSTESLLHLEERGNINNALNLDGEDLKKLSLRVIIDFLQMTIIGIKREELVSLDYKKLIEIFSSIYSGKKYEEAVRSTSSAADPIITESRPPSGPELSPVEPISPSISHTPMSAAERERMLYGTTDEPPRW